MNTSMLEHMTNDYMHITQNWNKKNMNWQKTRKKHSRTKSTNENYSHALTNFHFNNKNSKNDCFRFEKTCFRL